MGHPLDGSRLKLVRAEEHVNALAAEIAMYLQGRPWTVGPYKDGEVPQSIITVFPPPLRLSTIIGDCAVNARASLDYIVWELATRHFNPPLNSDNFKDRKLASFLISDSDSAEGYTNYLESLRKRQIPTAAIDEIKRVQPYNRGYEPLLWLNTLVNTDKHRNPILTLAYVPTVVWIAEGDRIMFYSSGQLKTDRETPGQTRNADER